MISRRCAVSHMRALAFGAVAASLLGGAPAFADPEPVRVGVLLPLSGTFTEYGKQIQNGIQVYLKQHGDVAGGRKIELIYKDDGGIAPEKAKKAAQELIVRDHVDVLAGFAFTASAMAVAPLAKEAGKPMIVMNAAASGITAASPTMVRVGQTLAQITEPAGVWAAKNGRDKVFTLVADVKAGQDAEAAFIRSFTANGGQIVGSLRVPAQNPDFAPFIQRIKDAHPRAVFVWLPPGEAAIAFLKGYHERGLSEAGVELLGTGDLTDDLDIEAEGDSALGVLTSSHYSMAHDSALNKRFVADYRAAFPNDKRPNFLSAFAYDAMALIYTALEKTGGKTDAEPFVAALKGLKLESPRGPIEIDAETRDIVQTVYMRKVQKVDGKLYNVEFESTPRVKDPVK